MHHYDKNQSRLALLILTHLSYNQPWQDALILAMITLLQLDSVVAEQHPVSTSPKKGPSIRLIQLGLNPLISQEFFL